MGARSAPAKPAGAQPGENLRAPMRFMEIP